MRYTIKEKKPLPKSEYLLEIEIPVDEITTREAGVLAHEASHLELPGFRKGKVPREIVKEKMGALALFEEAASEALQEALTEIFRSEKLDVIGRPRVEVQKLVPQNPAEFKITLTLYPTLALPDYKKIGALHASKPTLPITVETKEIEGVIAEIKRQHEKATGKKDFEVTDETVKELGEFENMADFTAKVKEGLEANKKLRGEEKRRGELLDHIVKETKGEIPDLLIESELQRIESELRGEIERMGATFDAYLKEIKKDIETVRKEWRPEAEKRSRLQLALLQIARAENLSPDKEEVAKEVAHLREHHKDVPEETARGFIETMLLNRKVIEFLQKS